MNLWIGLIAIEKMNPRMNDYQRDISEAEKIIELLDELYDRAKGV